MQISKNQDYSIQVPKATNDEVGQLADSFNILLQKIQQQTVELIEKNKKIFQNNKELAVVNSELQQFVYVASHDFQEPLRTIINFVELLNKSLDQNHNEDVAVYLKYIEDATTKMQRLIHELLDFSRIGKETPLEKVDCNKVLEDVKNLLGLKIKESKAIIHHTQLPIIKASEVEMRQLFMNLITNAIKYQKKDNIPKIEISSQEQQHEFLFTVADNGIGIEAPYLERVFIIFQRLHKASEYPGTGIGLAACKKIVEKYNGKIWVDSKKGEGSSFHFTIINN
ncbi:MAG: HAMP domain-containing sensor histidine kinase [Chitinophagaceae bacterium]|nr:MAG: HAMP domain-containing sensor histidine kinase [Chitinophagaceae bacterium]